MAYKRYYTDDKIRELCQKFNIDPDNLDSKAIEQKMSAYYKKHKTKVENQDANKITEQLLLNLQNKGINPFVTSNKK